MHLLFSDNSHASDAGRAGRAMMLHIVLQPFRNHLVTDRPKINDRKASNSSGIVQIRTEVFVCAI
jgi:hypothetical protein